MSESPKLYNQILLITPIFECAEDYSLATAVQNADYQPAFPMLPTPQTALLPYPLSQKYPEPLAFREADLRLVFPSPHLAAL